MTELILTTDREAESRILRSQKWKVVLEEDGPGVCTIPEGVHNLIWNLEAIDRQVRRNVAYPAYRSMLVPKRTK